MPSFKSKNTPSDSSRRAIAGLLSLTVVASSFGAMQRIAAVDAVEDAAEDSSVSQDENIIITKEFEYTPDPDLLPGENELYQAYLDKTLYSTPYSTAAYGSFGDGANTPLNATEVALYTGIKSAAEKIADGETSSSIITVSGISDLDSLDFNLVMGMVLEDCPYSFYWFDKTVRSDVKVSTNTVTGKSTLKIYSSVSANYSVSGETGTTDIDTTKTSAASKAKTTAQSIVKANAGKSDYEKLVAYKDYILEQADYNYDALDVTVPYGDPWQLIHVFDGDPSTKVVCEGYTKAYQYLCDLSAFEDDIFCMAASGVLISPSITGDHMWCVVSINDKSYLADISNSDSGMVGSNGELFLVAPSKGSYSSGYTFTINGNDITYSYNTDSTSTYGEKYLTLASENYKAAEKTVSTVIDGIEKDYSSIKEAVDAINASLSGGEITLLKDITISDTSAWTFSKPCDLNLNNYTLDLGTANIKVSGSKLSLSGSGTVKSKTSNAVISADSSSSIVITKGNVTNLGTGAAVEGGILTISGGTYTGKITAKGKSVISGGQFNGEVFLYDSACINGGTFKKLITVASGFNNIHFNGGSFGVGMSSSQKSISSSSELSLCISSTKSFFNSNNEPVDSSTTVIYGPVSISNAIDYGAMYTNGSITKKFETINQALSAAPAGSVVSLIKDCSLTSNVVISREITLDLNGKSLNCSSYNISSTGNLLIKDSSPTTTSATSLNIKPENIKIESGHYAKITVSGGTIEDILSKGKAYKTNSGSWLTDTSSLSLSTVNNVTVCNIPIKSFVVCEDIVHEVGSDDEIKLTANVVAESAGSTATIEWYKDGNTALLGSGASYTVADSLDVGKYKYVVKATVDGYSVTDSVIVTVSPHIIKLSEIAFIEGSVFEKEYDGTDTCVSAAVAILPDVVGNTKAIPITGTIKYNDTNVPKASLITFTADASTTDSYTIPAGLQLTHSASIKKAVSRTPSAPEIKTFTDTSITITAVNGMEYSLDKATWQPGPVFEGLNPNREYTIYQRVSGDDNHFASDASDGTKVSTLKRSLNKATVSLNQSSFTYDGESHIPDIKVSLNGSVVDKEQYSISISNTSGGDNDSTNAGKVTITITAKNDSDYSGSISASYTIEKADPHIGTVSIEGPIYTSTTVDNLILSRSDVSIPGNLEFIGVSSFKEGANSYNYRFTPDNSNYKTVEGTVSCNVIKDEVKSISIDGEMERSEYIYGEKPSLKGITITASYKSGQEKDVTSLVEYDTLLTAGQTSLKITYNGLSANIPITVSKATPEVSVPDMCRATYGSVLSDIELPDGWRWVNPQQTLETLGERKYSAVFTPEDTRNYNTVTADISVRISLEAPETTTGNKAVYGQKLSEIGLPKGWEWKEPTLKVGNAGENNTFTVIYGIDGLEETVTLNIQPAELVVSNVIVCNKEYNGDTSASIESIDFDGYVNGDTIVPYEYDASFDSSSAGEDKTVTVKIKLKSSNYILKSDTISAKASIYQSQPEISIPTGISASLSNTNFLYDIDLGDGWSWDEAYIAISEPGTYTFYATYTPQDSNYAPVKTAVTVIVSGCDHSSVTEKSEPASCTHNGYIEKICNDCGEVIYREEIKASHNWEDSIIITAPTCTTDGLSGIKCTNCDSIKPGSQQVVPAEGHHGGTTTCQHGAVCSECGVEYTLPVEHSWKDAFSNSEKYHWHECTVCGEKADKEKHNFKNNKCIECGYKRTVIEEAEAKVEDTVQHVFWDISVGAGLTDDGETLEYFEHDDYVVDDIVRGAVAIACALVAIGVARKEKPKQN